MNKFPSNNTSMLAYIYLNLLKQLGIYNSYGELFITIYSRVAMSFIIIVLYAFYLAFCLSLPLDAVLITKAATSERAAAKTAAGK